MKKYFIFAFIATVALCIAAFAQQNITAFMPATVVEASSTNTGPGAGVIGWNPNSLAVVQLTIVTTNVAHITARSNLVVRFDTSLNGTDWITNAYAITAFPTATANVASNSITRLTNTYGGQWLRVGTLENGGTNPMYIPRLFILTQ